MDKLRALHYLLKVADTLSFSRAALLLGVPASSVSRRLSDLEDALGVQLLHRTTRTVRLTEAGALYVEQVRAGVAQLTDADALVGHHGRAPSGTLRISAFPGYGQHLLMPVLQDFAAEYPAVTLDVHLTDALVELGRDQVDIAIRGGRQPQDRVVARRLDPNAFVLAASPAYLDEHGTPDSLDALASHRALMYRGPSAVLKWHGKDEDGWRELPMTPAFISNDGASLIALALRAQGVLLLPEWSLRARLDSGELRRLTLPQPVSVKRDEEGGIYLLYLQTRFRLPKVRVAVDYLMRRLAPPPDSPDTLDTPDASKD